MVAFSLSWASLITHRLTDHVSQHTAQHLLHEPSTLASSHLYAQNCETVSTGGNLWL